MTDSMGKFILLPDHTVQAEPDLMKWAEWVEHNDHLRVVRQDKINGSIMLSTVFLAMDMNALFNENKPTACFETMIFGGERDLEITRYATWDEALAGHMEILKELTNG
jgi:hypothetical protein